MTGYYITPESLSLLKSIPGEFQFYVNIFLVDRESNVCETSITLEPNRYEPITIWALQTKQKLWSILDKAEKMILCCFLWTPFMFSYTIIGG